MKGLYLAAVVLFVAAAALRNQLGGGIIATMVGIGIALVVVGLSEQYGRRKA